MNDGIVWVKRNDDGTYLKELIHGDSLECHYAASFAFAEDGRLYTASNVDLYECGNQLPPVASLAMFTSAMEISG